MAGRSLEGRDRDRACAGLALRDRVSAATLRARRAVAVGGLVLIGEGNMECFRLAAIAVVATRGLDDDAVRVRGARRM